MRSFTAIIATWHSNAAETVVQQRKQKTSRKNTHNRTEKVAQPQQQKSNLSSSNHAAETLL